MPQRGPLLILSAYPYNGSGSPAAPRVRSARMNDAEPPGTRVMSRAVAMPQTLHPFTAGCI